MDNSDKKAKMRWRNEEIAIGVFILILVLAVIGILIWLLVENCNSWSNNCCSSSRHCVTGHSVTQQTVILENIANQLLNSNDSLIFPELLKEEGPQIYFSITTGPTGATRGTALVDGIFQVGFSAAATLPTGTQVSLFANVNRGTSVIDYYGLQSSAVLAAGTIGFNSYVDIPMNAGDFFEIELGFTGATGTIDNTTVAPARLSMSFTLTSP